MYVLYFSETKTDLLRIWYVKVTKTLFFHACKTDDKPLINIVHADNNIVQHIF